MDTSIKLTIDYRTEYAIKDYKIYDILNNKYIICPIIQYRYNNGPKIDELLSYFKKHNISNVTIDGVPSYIESRKTPMAALSEQYKLLYLRNKTIFDNGFIYYIIFYFNYQNNRVVYDTTFEKNDITNQDSLIKTLFRYISTNIDYVDLYILGFDNSENLLECLDFIGKYVNNYDLDEKEFSIQSLKDMVNILPYNPHQTTDQDTFIDQLSLEKAKE